jgi:proteic killer suppression protein
MIIEFSNRRIERICLDKEQARKKYGMEIAKKLILRLNQLQAFDNLKQVPHTRPFRRHKLKGKYDGCFAVDIVSGYRLIFKPVTDNGINVDEMNMSKINRILILEVKDYHD